MASLLNFKQLIPIILHQSGAKNSQIHVKWFSHHLAWKPRLLEVCSKTLLLVLLKQCDEGWYIDVLRFQGSLHQHHTIDKQNHTKQYYILLILYGTWGSTLWMFVLITSKPWPTLTASGNCLQGFHQSCMSLLVAKLQITYEIRFNEWFRISGWICTS